MGLLKQTDVTKNTARGLRGRVLTGAGAQRGFDCSAAWSRAFGERAPDAAAGRKPQMGDQDTSPNSPLLASQWSASARVTAARSLLSLEIMPGHAFANNRGQSSLGDRMVTVA